MKKKFMAFLDTAIKNKSGIKLHVKLPGLKKPEVMHHPAHNVKSKRAYYEEHFKEDLKSVNDPNKQIVDWELWE